MSEYIVGGLIAAAVIGYFFYYYLQEEKLPEPKAHVSLLILPLQIANKHRMHS